MESGVSHREHFTDDERPMARDRVGESAQHLDSAPSVSILTIAISPASTLSATSSPRNTAAAWRRRARRLPRSLKCRRHWIRGQIGTKVTSQESVSIRESGGNDGAARKAVHLDQLFDVLAAARIRLEADYRRSRSSTFTLRSVCPRLTPTSTNVPDRSLAIARRRQRDPAPGTPGSADPAQTARAPAAGPFPYPR